LAMIRPGPEVRKHRSPPFVVAGPRAYTFGWLVKLSWLPGICQWPNRPAPHATDRSRACVFIGALSPSGAQGVLESRAATGFSRTVNRFLISIAQEAVDRTRDRSG
jgi:hypothetical protein